MNKKPEFRKFMDFPRGTMYDWKESDDFFYDNPEIVLNGDKGEREIIK